MAGASTEPPRLAEAAVVLIDCQMEYVNGALPLSGVDAALDEVLHLVGRARRVGAPIIHIAHKGKPGGLFDRSNGGGQIAPQATPAKGELVIEKTLPNAFAGTDLHERLQEMGRSEIVVAGFMSHMCVSSTVRAGVDLGYRMTVVEKAVATRDLPTPKGEVLPAAQLHEASMTALADRFAVIVGKVGDLRN